jgi:hypothetical protein
MDPIGIAGGANVYGFAGGDPVNFSDPFGLWPDPTKSQVRVAKFFDSEVGQTVLAVACLLGCRGTTSAAQEQIDRAQEQPFALAMSLVGPSGGSRRPSASTRREVIKRATDADGIVRCEYCGRATKSGAGDASSLELDHVDPWSRGGSSVADNLAASCMKCNRGKGAQTPEEVGLPRPPRDKE